MDAGSQLDALREARDRLQTEREVAQLKAEISAYDAERRQQQLLEVGQVLGSRTGYLYDHPGFGNYGAINSPSDSIYGIYHHDQIDDRLDGRYRPIYENETHLSQQRGICRVLEAIDEHAIGGLESLANYTLGTGYVYNVTAKRDEYQPVADACQAVLDEFTGRRNLHWRRKEREFHKRSRRDGEVYLTTFPIGRGRAGVEFVEPAEITEPMDQTAASDYLGGYLLDWKMGIATEWNKGEPAYGYYRDKTGDDQDWDIITPDRMVHSKRNVDERAKRGVSDYFPVWQDLERAAKVLRNTGEGASLQAAIAWIREHVPGTSLAAVQSMSSPNLVAEVNRAWPTGNTTTTKYRRYNPGTILDVPAGQQYKPGPMGAERNDGFVMVADALWRSTGVRWNMPEYMATGDPSSGSFASTLVAESPFVKAREADQVWYGEEFIIVMWNVLSIAINTGQTLRQRGVMSLDQLEQLVNIEIDYPRVSVRNRIEETQISSVLNDKGLLSDRSWSAKEDLDYEQQQSQREEDGDDKKRAARRPPDPFGSSPVGPAQGAFGSLASGPSGEQPAPLSRLLGRSTGDKDAEPSMPESLEAVAQDADGIFRPIAELPEMPNPWENYP